MAHRLGRMTLAVVATAALVAGCGEGVEQAGSSQANAASSTAGDPQQTTAAQQKVDVLTKQPTSIPLTTPLKSKPQPGGTFVWLSCDNTQCPIIGAGIKEATEAIGWNYKQQNYKSADPATLVTALDDALRMNPSAVALSGLPRAVWQNAATAYQQANVPISIGYVGGGDNVAAPIVGEIGGDADIGGNATALAEWFIADSKAAGHAVLLSVNDFPVLKTFSDTFKKTVAADCSACKVTEVNATIAQVSGGQTVAPLVSAIQSDPSINYVMASNMPFVSGIQGQLSAAGLQGKVKIAGNGADTEGLQLLKNGTYSATTSLALRYTGWAMVDMVLRHQQGLPPATGADGMLPAQLLTPDVPFDIADSYDKPADFRDQVKKLWQLG